MPASATLHELIATYLTTTCFAPTLRITIDPDAVTVLHALYPYWMRCYWCGNTISTTRRVIARTHITCELVRPVTSVTFAHQMHFHSMSEFRSFINTLAYQPRRV